MKKILFYGETSKTAIHGVSISNDLFLSDLDEYFDISIVDELSNLASHGQVGFKKITNLVIALWQVFLNIKNRHADYFYCVLSLSSLGAIKTLLMLFTVSVFSSDTKIVLHIHRGDLLSKIKKRNFLSFLLKVNIRKAHKVLLISEKQTIQFNQLNFLGRDHYCYVANSAQIPKVIKQEKALKSHYLFLSNYIKEKGIFDLLDVWKDLPTSMELKCFGSETPDVTISILKTRYPLKNTSFSGSVSGNDKFTEINSARALILPSWNEGAPLVLIEAMSFGIPIICSDVGFVREMLGATYPFLYSSKNKEELKSVVKAFHNLSNVELTKLSQELKLRYELNFSRDKRISDYLHVFNS